MKKAERVFQSLKRVGPFEEFEDREDETEDGGLLARVDVAVRGSTNRGRRPRGRGRIRGR